MRTRLFVLLSVLVHMTDYGRKVAADYNNLSVNDTRMGGCTFINAKIGTWFTDACSSIRRAVCKGTLYNFARCFLKTLCTTFLVYSL